MTKAGAIAVLAALLLCSGTLDAQEQDFQSWWELGVEKQLSRDVDLGLELEQRFKSNSTRYDRSLMTISAGWGALDYLDVGGGLRVLTVMDDENGIGSRFRLHADATGKYTLAPVRLSLRARLQYGFEEVIYLTDMSFNVLVNRLRLKAAHDFFGSRYSAFASMESWGLFYNQDGRFFKRMRYTAGMSYRLNMHSALQARLMLEDEFHQPRPRDTWVLVLGYSCSL